MHILGVDPGVRNIGVSVVKIHDNYFKELLLSTTFIPKDKNYNFLIEIADYFQSLIEKYPISVLAWEEPYQNNKYSTDKFMYYGVGVLLETMQRNKVTVFGYAPSSIKKIVAGKGNASKAEMKEAIENCWLLDSSNTSHSIDALACIETYLHLQPNL